MLHMNDSSVDGVSDTSSPFEEKTRQLDVKPGMSAIALSGDTVVAAHVGERGILG